MNRKTIKKLVTYMLVIGLWISFISTSSLAIKDPASEESQMQDAKVDKILEEVRIQTNIEIKSEAKLPDIDLIVESDHVKLKNFPPTWLIWNEDVGFWNEFEGEAIAQADGSQYGIAFFVKADEGFKFTRDTKIYLNNEEVSSIYGNKILLDPEPISAKIYLNMGFVSPDKDPQKVFKVDFIDETHNTETPSLILGEETTILAPAVPQFEGDTFYGWIDEDGKDVDFNNYVIKEDTTFYADWYGAQISGEIKDIEVNINEWANIDLSVKKNNRINSFLLKKIDGNWQEVGQAIDVTDLDLLRLAPSDIEKTEVYKLVIDPGHKYSLESNEFTVTWVNPNPEQDSEAPIPGEESPQVPEEDPQAP
ncbi:MAG: hypothetical protein Q4E50_06955, partial [Tissierellia bacterium]|nr:hypothetical protein [Tissierellia bacterium]